MFHCFNDATFTADCEAVLVRAGQPDDFFDMKILKAQLPDSKSDAKTRPLELSAKTDLERHATIVTFSPPGRENAAMGEDGEFLTVSLLMKMISPSAQMAAACE